jgi:hypothetical protein
MSKSVAQDDARQQLIAVHCGLFNSSKRYGADALDEQQNEFEIKSGTTKNFISTARDFGFNILNEYRKKYWVIASGTLHNNKIYTMDELYIAHPNNLEFFFGKVEETLQQHQHVVNLIKNTNIPLVIQEKKLMDKILHRGMTLNDPRINMKDVRVNCTKLDHYSQKKATQQVKMFVKNNPIHTKLKVTKERHNFW